MSENNILTLHSSNALRKLQIRLLVFIILFLFTLGFEMLSNLIILSLFLISLNLLKFNKIFFLIIVFLFLLFFLFYIKTYNNLYFKYLIFILRMFCVISFLNYLYSFRLKSLQLRSIIEKIFFLHTFCIIICFVFPKINSIVNSVFAYSERVSNFRISGLFSGFDIVPFFILIYLSYEYLCNRKIVNSNFLIKLLLGSFAILQSGRFGVIPLALFVFLLFAKRRNLKWVILSIPIVFIIYVSGILDKRIDNITSTFDMLQVAANDIDLVDNSFFEDKNIEGQYNQSPITWYFEAIKPFRNISDYLFPRKGEIVDSGPSFFVLNFGLLIAIFLYVLYFNFFNLITKKRIPYLVVTFFLAADLKFRLLYSLMPLLWLALNHFSYMQELENTKPKSA